VSNEDERTEVRVKALLRARLCGSGFERDACILDLTSEGLLLTAAMPPRCSNSVTIVANGYSMPGEVKWVSERRFGVRLHAPIEVGDVIGAKILNPTVNRVSTPLPESFGIRPQQASAAMTLANVFESQWTRYGAIIVIGVALAIYAGMFAGHHAGKMADQLASVKEASHAESRALGK
jgi:hypothetical protein